MKITKHQLEALKAYGEHKQIPIVILFNDQDLNKPVNPEMKK